MASYDIIGGIVDPKALAELQNLEKIANNIAIKLRGVTLGSMSKEADAALVQRLNAETAKLVAQEQKLQNQIQKTNQARSEKIKLTTEEKVSQTALNNVEKLSAVLASQYTTALQKLDAQIKLNIIDAQKYVQAGDTQNPMYLQNIANTKKLSQEYDRLAKASGATMQKTSSMYGATFSLTQVMRELPNFAIDARIGFMALSNNLPMLAENFSRVKHEIDSITGKEKGFIGAFKEFGKSLLSLNTIMIVVSTVMILFGDDIVKLIGNLVDGKKEVDYLTSSIKKLNDSVSDKMVSNMEKVVGFAHDYYKASKDGDKEKIKQLTEIGKKEYNLNQERLDMIAKNVNSWRIAFKDYLELARKTYINEFRIKEGAEIEYQGKKIAAERDYQAKILKERMIKAGVSPLAAEGAIQNLREGTDFGLPIKGVQKYIDKWNELNNLVIENNKKLLPLSLISLEDVYSTEIKKINPTFERDTRDKNTDMKYLFSKIGLPLDYEKIMEQVNKNIVKLQTVDENELGMAIDRNLRYASKMYEKGALTFQEFETFKTMQLQIAKDNNIELTDEMWDILTQATDKGIQSLIEMETELMNDRLDRVEQFYDVSLALADSFYKMYNEKLEEQSEKEKKIEDEKYKDIEDREKAGVITKQEAEEEKARTAEYYLSVQDEINRRKEEQERRQFLLEQAAAIAKIWINYVLTASAYNAQSAAAPLLAPYFQGMKAEALYEAIAGSAVAAGQAIPYFKDGVESSPEGLAVLGDGYKHELAITPSGKYFISDNKPTMYNLEKGTQILPDINRMDLASILALKQVMPEMKDNTELLSELRNVTNAVKSQRQGNFYGMPLIKQIENRNKYSSRSRSLMN